MDIQTFRAGSLQEALQLVRRSLGPDASVIQTREVRPSRLSLFGKTIVEVEASLLDPAVSRTRGNAAGSRLEMDSSRGRATRATSVQPTPTQQVGSSRPGEAVDSRPASEPRWSAQPPVTSSPHASSANLSGQSEVQARPLRKTPSGHAGSLGPALLEVLSELLDSGLPGPLASQLVQEVSERIDAPEQDDPWLVKGQINQLVARQLNVSGSIELKSGRQQVVALVGPTGVGKTTTLAKIAAGFRFDLGLDVGLITLDTFRLGAVDQLLQYAELISAPLEVVSAPDQVAAARQRLRECDLILVDTAGRSPRDAEQLSVLADFLRAAQPDSTHLVVSASSSVTHASDTLQRFAIVQPTHLIVTKMDEAVAFGSWLPLLRDQRLPVSYLTNGQHVPEDISVANPRRLANMLLGQRQAFGQPPQLQSQGV